MLQRPCEATWMTVRGLSDGYHRGKPNRVTHAERMRYVSEHLVLITLAPGRATGSEIVQPAGKPTADFSLTCVTV